jgi:LPXTG-motif cell wall-anchored protein
MNRTCSRPPDVPAAGDHQQPRGKEKTMTKNRLLIALAIVALLGAGALAAQDDSQNITGTVVSATPTSLVIQTADGQKSFILDAESQTPESLSAGNQVTVDYRSNDQGEMVVSNVTLEVGGAMEDSHVASTEPEAAPAPSEESAGQPADLSANNGDASATSLPATGSSLPLIGLLGLAALAGGLVLRQTR